MSTKSARLLWAGVCAATMVLAGSETPATASETSLRVLWSDQEGFLRDKLLSRGYDTMTKEVSAILEDAGIDVTWSPLTAKPTGGIVVILTPVDASDWGLPAGTLGAVMGRDGPVTCVYVFYPAVARLLGVGRTRRSTRDFHELGKAIGRVAAHEIVHALTPDAPHTREGLMMAHFTRDALRRRHLRLSDGAAVSFEGARAHRDKRQ